MYFIEQSFLMKITHRRGLHAGNELQNNSEFMDIVVYLYTYFYINIYICIYILGVAHLLYFT